MTTTLQPASKLAPLKPSQQQQQLHQHQQKHTSDYDDAFDYDSEDDLLDDAHGRHTALPPGEPDEDIDDDVMNVHDVDELTLTHSESDEDHVVDRNKKIVLSAPNQQQQQQPTTVPIKPTISVAASVTSAPAAKTEDTSLASKKVDLSSW